MMRARKRTTHRCHLSANKESVGFKFFFFSSRRRHTRCLSDWSSDVCSSDLSLISCARNQGAAGSQRASNSPTQPAGILTAGALSYLWQNPGVQELRHRAHSSQTISSHGVRSEERRVGKEGRYRWGPSQREQE